MSSRNLIRLSPDLEHAFWMRIHPRSARVLEAGESSLDKLPPPILSQSVLVLIPASLTHLSRIACVSRNRSRMLQAAPYLIEDDLVQDVGSMDVALGPIGKDKMAWVAAIDQNLVKSLMQKLKGAGLARFSICPDALLFGDLADEQWTVLADGEVFSAMHGNQAAYSGDIAWIESVLDRARFSGNDTRWFLTPGTKVPGLDADVATESDMSRLFAAGLRQGASLDLTAGRAGQVGGSRGLLMSWKTSAALLLALLIAQVALLSWNIHRLEIQKVDLQQQQTAIFQKRFPQEPLSQNFRARMEMELDKLAGRRPTSGDNEFHALLAQVAPVITKHRGVKLRALRYRDGLLELDIHTPGVKTLDNFTAELEARARAAIERPTAVMGDSGVDAKIRVGGS